MKETYEQMKYRVQTKVNEWIDTNVFYAFNEQQLLDCIDMYETTINDITYIGGGAYLIDPSKLDEYKNLLRYIDNEFIQFLQQDLDNFRQGVMYELWEHEYYFNGDTANVLGALGFEPQDLNQQQVVVFNECVDEYNKEVQEQL